ncbi:hypothetical protein TCAL_03243 [Tigriopus californicus]|uniref:Cytochrome P450 n=1 Tax=Tigriopus californicus TaxID=6832 RepID=A0A553NTA8_TIGCA|nr:methyl farnesoate epoxidase-like [Tigriopus californicus]TRY68671.1 hypothetical protein TCAL_03243 [Tigriopus californicus]|eukprot:TCALIF_03243-PA protein Name:"Similar to CYP2L1 Cytochrome P450 2L1 (Panulirus argus)" AED:0.04 eAED:0.04 QI:0/1/0/1/1/1/3/0/485
MIFIAVILILISFWIFLKGTKKPKNFPPGPPIVPILGSIPFMKGPTLNEKIWSKDLADQFGPVIGLIMGNKPFVMITDPKVAKQALSGEDLIGRPRDPLALEVRAQNGKFFGLFLADGDNWKHQRRFTLKVMKDIGIGRSVSEDAMILEADKLVQEFDKTVYQDLLMDGQFNIPVVNVLWVMLANVRYEYNDPEILAFMELLRQLFRGGGFLKQFFGVLKYFPNLSGLNVRRATNQKLRIPIQREIDNHKAYHKTTKSHMNDFIGQYLEEMETDPMMNENELMNICQDLFGAGSETVSSTLLFSISFLTMYPDVQDECFQEILNLERGGTQVSLQNQNKFVFVNATINEVFRKSSLTASIIPHRALRDTKILDYDIPYDTMILTNMMLNNNDPIYHINPEDFNPKRFINESQKLVKNDVLTPFGVGKRVCPGESLARGEIFIFLAKLIRAFQFCKPVEHPPPNADVVWGMARLPKPFYVYLKVRK